MKQIAKWVLIASCCLLVAAICVLGVSIMRFSSQFNSGLDSPAQPFEGDHSAAMLGWTASGIEHCRVSRMYLIKGSRTAQIRFRYSDQNTSGTQRDLEKDTTLLLQAGEEPLEAQVAVSALEIMSIQALEYTLTLDMEVLEALPNGSLTITIQSGEGKNAYAGCILEVPIKSGQYADLYVESFSYAQDSARFSKKDTVGPFVNTEQTVIATGYEALVRARKEVTVPYSKVEVARDQEAKVWRVTFSNTEGIPYVQQVYMGENGITLAITTAQ